ncbi:MAG: hypothetical protein H7836_16935, partial [Magnetococcus sp. YQC-3]
MNELVTFIKANSQVVIIVRETDANRPHLHCVLTGFNQTKSTFFQKFTKLFPMLKGNRSFSCEKKDDYEAQIRYCCKGLQNCLPEVLFVDCEINIQTYHEAYWAENLLLKAKGKKDE